MNKTAVCFTVCFVLGFLLVHTATAQYSRWTIFGGLNLIHNSDGEGIQVVPGMGPGGAPGGLASGPSPIAVFGGAEYRLPLTGTLTFAPSLSLYSTAFLWSGERALPTELENRTVLVPVLLLDLPVLYLIEQGNFLYSLGGGLATALRWSFLEPGVPSDARNPGEPLSAGDQVKAVNDYLWSSGRWLYPIVQAGIRYRLQTGWGGGLTIRAAIPVFNLWSNPKVPFMDSFMIMTSLTITPPSSRKPSPVKVE